MISLTRFNTARRRLHARHLSMAVAIGLLSCLVARVSAQTTTPPSAQTTANPPLMDNKVFVDALFDQFEGRTNGSDGEFRWDGQAYQRISQNEVAQ